MVPATQRWCIAPKRSEEIRKEGQVNRSAGTLSKSAAMRRRTRKPRKASSSASGTITTDPNTRKASQAAAANMGIPDRALGIVRDVSAAAVAFSGSRAIQRAKTRIPMPAAGHDHDQRRPEYPLRRTQKANPAAATRAG